MGKKSKKSTNSGSTTSNNTVLDNKKSIGSVTSDCKSKQSNGSLINESSSGVKTKNKTQSDKSVSEAKSVRQKEQGDKSKESKSSKEFAELQKSKLTSEEKEIFQNAASNMKNSDTPLKLSDLVGSITKAANDRKKAAGSAKKDNELKDELASLLRQIKMDEKVKNSPLASEKPLSNEEGLNEILHYLKALKSESQRREQRPTSKESSPSIAESLLDSTNRARKLTTQESSDSEGVKEEVGTCEFCELEATTKCTGCRKVFYCSRDCQKSHWNVHKDVCRPYKVS